MQHRIRRSYLLRYNNCTSMKKMTIEYDWSTGVQIRQYNHRIRIHRRATRVGAFEVFEAAHVALRTLLAFSQPVNCIFWPIGMLNWLVAASKLHKHRVTCSTAERPFYSFLIIWYNYKMWPQGIIVIEKFRRQSKKAKKCFHKDVQNIPTTASAAGNHIYI